MTIDEAIKHCLEVAEQEDCFINYPHSDIVLGDLDIESHKHYAVEQRQLAEWLTELKELRSLKTDYVFFKAEAKKLLKAAVEDFNKSLGAAYTCPYCKYERRKHETCAEREAQYCGDICKWRYADEVEKLFKEE